MKVESLKDFTTLVRTCRRLGVERITVDGLSIELGSVPHPTPRKSHTPESNTPATPELTDEDVMFWSSSAPSPEPK